MNDVMSVLVDRINELEKTKEKLNHKLQNETKIGSRQAYRLMDVIDETEELICINEKILSSVFKMSGNKSSYLN